MKQLRLLACFALAAGLSVGAFAADAPSASLGSAPAVSAPSAPADPSKISGASYVLQPTDTIRIKVADDPRADKEGERIAMDGTINLIYVNEPIKISGMTIAEAIAAIQKKYVDEKIFKRPQVSVAMVTFAERRINVMGQVAMPGWVLIPPEENLTLVSAVTRAGGPTRLASVWAFITRKTPDGKTEKIEKNLKAAMKDASKDFSLQKDDSIYVPEDFIGGNY